MMKRKKQILFGLLLLFSLTSAANMPAPRMYTISPQVIIVSNDNEEYIIGCYDKGKTTSDFTFSQAADYKAKGSSFSGIDSTGKIIRPSICYNSGDTLIIDLNMAVDRDSSANRDCIWHWDSQEQQWGNLDNAEGDAVAVAEEDLTQEENLPKSEEELRRKIIEGFKACDTTQLIRAKGKSIIHYTGKSSSVNVVIYKPSTDWYYISPTILNDYKQESVPHIPNSLQWITILLSMIITVIVEVGVGWLFFYRSKKDLTIIAATNAITNILMNITLCSTIFANTSYAKGLGFAALLIVVEPIIWIVESIVYSCALEKKAKHYILKAWTFALAANVASLLIGLLFGQCVRELALLIMHP